MYAVQCLRYDERLRVVRKTSFFAPCYTKTRSIYQDRLGTSIGKVEEKISHALSAGGPGRRPTLSTSPRVRKTPLSCGAMFLMKSKTIMNFTKTGSRHTRYQKR